MTPEQKQVRLGVVLNDPWYTEGPGKPVKERIESGELKIEMGEDNWPEGWYKDPYFNISVPFALTMAHNLPDVKVFKLYYWRGQDFHHIEFEYDGDTYIVQWYKIFTLHRKSDGQKHYFAHGCERYDIPEFFKSGKHRTSPHWSEGSKTFNPFESLKEAQS